MFWWVFGKVFGQGQEGCNVGCIIVGIILDLVIVYVFMVEMCCQYYYVVVVIGVFDFGQDVYIWQVFVWIMVEGIFEWVFKIFFYWINIDVFQVFDDIVVGQGIVWCVGFMILYYVGCQDLQIVE